jgi:transcriptional regulator with XRE-family HTH domain
LGQNVGGISQGAISDYENGKSEPIGGHLIGLAMALEAE